MCDDYLVALCNVFFLTREKSDRANRDRQMPREKEREREAHERVAGDARRMGTWSETLETR